MKRIDTSKWKEFRVGELFPNIVKPHVYHSREVKESIEGIPYIVRSKFNNGIKCRVEKKGVITSPKGVISFGAENASFFYQKEEWCSGRDIYYIDTQEISDYACKFLIACLNRLTDKYSYNYGLFPDLLKKEKVLLPATPSGDPNWEYMENYMRKYEQQTTASITGLKHLTETHKLKRIDTSKWKEFRVGDWFITEANGKQVPTGASISKLELKENGSTPRISVTGVNNGILGYFDYIGTNTNNYRVYQNFISVSFLGTVFYQKDSASLDMKVHCLKPFNTELNEYTGSFLVAAIKASLKNYEYSDQLSSTVLPNINIKLPASPSGAPDWNLMEQYMRQVELQVKNSIIALTTPTPQVQQQTNLVNYGTVNIYEK